jgi:predicted peroxiredoxin
MAKRLLQIIGTAYRATLEEQDDPVLWLTQALRSQGAEVEVLLQGNAVRGQDAGGLVFGDRVQTQPPHLEADLARLIAAGVKVYLAEDDLGVRGIRPSELVEGVTKVHGAQLPSLLREFDQVWAW